MSLASPIGRAWAALDAVAAARYRAGRDRGHRGRRPGLAGLAGIEAGAIRGARPCDMITAPGWRAGRAWLSRRGVLELFPGKLPPGASRQSRGLTAPVPVRACPTLCSPGCEGIRDLTGSPGIPQPLRIGPGRSGAGPAARTPAGSR